MIFFNRMMVCYRNPDPVAINKFAQQVLILGAQFRGEIPNG